ncbi:TetR/AcrR family transcriptional regulator [Rubrobacter tropicus]|uniref:TetR/AcrR family transcriptional regulator n=1 Tax=Rubrobacter tropicus TaxID=2653851 RepID=UPI001A9FCFF8|nr:TetR/AcrR family transcriptional regulator [Rubrobacter tropicus]
MASRERGDTRGALIRAAAGLLEERGMTAVTLRAVGERAGISRQAPYRHFADKEELLSVVAAGYFEQVGEKMAGAAGAADGSFERLDAMTAAYVGFALENPARTRLMFGPEVKGSAYPVAHEAARAVHERFVRAVADCQEAGLLPGEDPVELAALVYATAHGAVDLTLSGHTEKAKGLGDPLALTRRLLAYLGAR